METTNGTIEGEKESGALPLLTRAADLLQIWVNEVRPNLLLNLARVSPFGPSQNSKTPKADRNDLIRERDCLSSCHLSYKSLLCSERGLEVILRDADRLAPALNTSLKLQQSQCTRPTERESSISTQLEHTPHPQLQTSKLN